MCGMHSTGRSAAFWLESYGGPRVALRHRGVRAPAWPGGRVSWRSAAPSILSGRWLGRTFPTAIVARPGSSAPRSSDGARPAPALDRRDVEPGCADIDVAALHAAFLRAFRRAGGTVADRRRLLRSASGRGGDWAADPRQRRPVAARDRGQRGRRVGRPGRGALRRRNRSASRPKRRTMVQLRVGRQRAQAPAAGHRLRRHFYFKGEGDRSIWVSPHDEIAGRPVRRRARGDRRRDRDRPLRDRSVDWPVEAVERSWAGLRSFAPDRRTGLRLRHRCAGLLLVCRAGRLRHPDRPRGSENGRRAAVGRSTRRNGRAHRPEALLGHAFRAQRLSPFLGGKPTSGGPGHARSKAASAVQCRTKL